MALLAYLAAATPHGYHSRDKLLGLLWPESDLDHARNSLRQSLHFLRRRLGPHALVNRGEGELAVALDSLKCDVVEFEAALESGDEERALALYRADLLEGFFIPRAGPFEQWLDEERARLRRWAVAAAWHLSEQAADAGEDELGHRWARRAVELDPANESSVRKLIETLGRLGNGATAARVYHDFAAYLAREYDLEPSPETTAAMEAVRRRANSVAIMAPVAAWPPPGDLEPPRRAPEIRQHAVPTPLGWFVRAARIATATMASWLPTYAPDGPSSPSADPTKVPHAAPSTRQQAVLLRHEPVRPSSAACILWAVLSARIFEVLPPFCRACDGEMSILAFLADPAVVFASLVAFYA